jgi:hypothetical protein
MNSLYYYEPFRRLSTYVTRQFISGHHLTQSEYALQQVVELFGNLLIQLGEAHLTHTTQVVFRFYQLENIAYLVLRYLNTSALPFEEWAKEWLFDGEVYSTFTSATGLGDGSILGALGQVIQKVESWDKTRRK